MRSLEENIAHFAKVAPGKPAIICGNEMLSYANLWERIQQRAMQLREEGLCSPENGCQRESQSQPYAFAMSQDVDSIVTYCAIHYCGAASVLHTTGTTGEVKGVIISANAWTANAENLIDRLGFTSDLLFIICGPLSHLGSLSKIYPTLMTGGTLYIMENLKDMNAFFAPFKSISDTFCPMGSRVGTFLVPSAIRMFLLFARKELAAVAPKIDFIETGAAPISQHDMEQLCELLPHSRLYNTYASTETGIVCSYEFSKYGCHPGLVGTPMKHSSVRIAEDGRVVCSGPTIMSGYLDNPDATAQVLRDGEVYTSDIGSLDENGMLHLQGRMDDIINAGGYKVNPSEVEDAAGAFERIQDCICIPAPHPLLGTAPKLLYVPRTGCAVKFKEIADFLRERIDSYKIPLFYEAVESIKHTYNGKPDRKAYRSGLKIKD